MLFILAFTALGYLSNAMTANACKQEAARWLDAGLSGSDWPQRRASSKPAEFRWPWIVSVDYELVLGNLGGEWGTRRYLCLFGIPIPLGNDIYMQS